MTPIQEAAFVLVDSAQSGQKMAITKDEQERRRQDPSRCQMSMIRICFTGTPVYLTEAEFSLMQAVAESDLVEEAKVNYNLIAERRSEQRAAKETQTEGNVKEELEKLVAKLRAPHRASKEKETQTESEDLVAAEIRAQYRASRLVAGLRAQHRASKEKETQTERNSKEEGTQTESKKEAEEEFEEAMAAVIGAYGQDVHEPVNLDAGSDFDAVAQEILALEEDMQS